MPSQKIPQITWTPHISTCLQARMAKPFEWGGRCLFYQYSLLQTIPVSLPPTLPGPLRHIRLLWVVFLEACCTQVAMSLLYTTLWCICPPSPPPPPPSSLSSFNSRSLVKRRSVCLMAYLRGAHLLFNVLLWFMEASARAIRTAPAEPSKQEEQHSYCKTPL